jgi:hypothetical protein
MSESDVGFGTPFNVIAAFPHEHDSTVAVDVLVGEGVPRSAIEVHRPDQGPTGEEISELEAEMQDELVGSWGALSGPQAKRAFRAAVILGGAGIVLGVVAGFGWAYLFSSGLSRMGRVVTMASVTGLAGATIGLVDGGGGLKARRVEEGPDTDDEPMVGERDVLVAVHFGDPVVAEGAAARLRELGAERVHLIDVHGIPLPPQAWHPRPADPEGWWWRRAGDG